MTTTAALALAPPTLRAWTSWELHLGSGDPAVADRVLQDVVAPVVAHFDRRPVFFLRFWQGGPHVRLRIADLDSAGRVAAEAMLRERLPDAIRLRDGETALDPETFAQEAAAHARGESGADRQVRPLLEPGLHPGTYEPEFERYGGEAVMSANEDLFAHSSRLVLAVLPKLTTEAARQSVALRMTVAAAQVTGSDRDEALFYRIGEQVWRTFVGTMGYPDQFIEQLTAVPDNAVSDLVGAAPSGPFDTWQHAVAALVASLDEDGEGHPAQVIASHVHMLHNRLGLPAHRELRSFALLARSVPEIEL